MDRTLSPIARRFIDCLYEVAKPLKKESELLIPPVETQTWGPDGITTIQTGCTDTPGCHRANVVCGRTGFEALKREPPRYPLIRAKQLVGCAKAGARLQAVHHHVALSWVN
jgi:hypothetical protein